MATAVVDSLPKATVTIRTRVSARHLELLRAMAQEDCTTVSHVVRRIVAHHLRDRSHGETVSGR